MTYTCVGSPSSDTPRGPEVSADGLAPEYPDPAPAFPAGADPPILRPPRAGSQGMSSECDVSSGRLRGAGTRARASISSSSGQSASCMQGGCTFRTLLHSPVTEGAIGAIQASKAHIRVQTERRGRGRLRQGRRLSPLAAVPS